MPLRAQRTMTHPARIRLHYGHPDLFNKLFVMTKGGISKATRLLHLTEDVFCGCNHILRGGKVRCARGVRLRPRPAGGQSQARARRAAAAASCRGGAMCCAAPGAFTHPPATSAGCGNESSHLK